MGGGGARAMDPESLQGGLQGRRAGVSSENTLLLEGCFVIQNLEFRIREILDRFPIRITNPTQGVKTKIFSSLNTKHTKKTKIYPSKNTKYTKEKRKIYFRKEGVDF